MCVALVTLEALTDLLFSAFDVASSKKRLRWMFSKEKPDGAGSSDALHWEYSDIFLMLLIST